VTAAFGTDVYDRVRAILQPKSEILEAYVFGSVARGQAAAHSDLDVAVFVSESVLTRPGGFGYEAELTTDLMAALGTNEVDVVVLNHASPVLYHRVLRDGERILSRDLAATTTREGRALSRYCDYVPQLRKIEELSRRRIRSGEFGR
jgi:hypothetical protein